MNHNICYIVESQDFHLQVMFIGLLLKFMQNFQLLVMLRSTGTALIAEASVSDQYWGNGVHINNTTALRNPDNWVGTNRLGKLLMELRDTYCNKIY